MLLVLLVISCNAVSQDTLVPEHRLQECADSAINFALRASQVQLDYSPESLRYVDGFMNDLHTKRAPANKVSNHVLVMGCYAGEVFVRSLKGKWIYPTAETKEKLGPGPFVQLPGGVLTNPLDKVQRIYEEGLTHSIYKFFLVTEAMGRSKQDKP